MSGRGSTSVIRQRSTRANAREHSTPRPMRGIPTSMISIEPPAEKQALSAEMEKAPMTSPRGIDRVALHDTGSSGDRRKVRSGPGPRSSGAGPSRVSMLLFIARTLPLRAQAQRPTDDWARSLPFGAGQKAGTWISVTPTRADEHIMAPDGHAHHLPWR